MTTRAAREHEEATLKTLIDRYCRLLELLIALYMSSRDGKRVNLPLAY